MGKRTLELFKQPPAPPPPPGTVTLTIKSAKKDNLDGFLYFWLKYVKGFNPEQHCAACLLGNWSRHTKKTMATNRTFVLDEHTGHRFLYLCGVSTAGWAKNLHVAMVPQPGARIEVPTFNGFTVVVENAVQVAIPPLPRHFRGLGWSYTSCRNFQFGVAHLEPIAEVAVADLALTKSE